MIGESMINCTPSAKLCADMPDVSTSFAQEGTDAHEVCEYELKKALGQKMTCPVENLTYYNSEMQECADGYRDYVMELVEEARQQTKDVVVLVEQKIQYERREKAIEWMKNLPAGKEGTIAFLNGVTEEHCKAFVLSITIHSPLKYTVHWFDDTKTEVQMDSNIEDYRNTASYYDGQAMRDGSWRKRYVKR